jgi:hypothetical protein
MRIYLQLTLSLMLLAFGSSSNAAIKCHTQSNGENFLRTADYFKNSKSKVLRACYNTRGTDKGECRSNIQCRKNNGRWILPQYSCKIQMRSNTYFEGNPSKKKAMASVMNQCMKHYSRNRCRQRMGCASPNGKFSEYVPQVEQPVIVDVPIPRPRPNRPEQQEEASEQEEQEQTFTPVNLDSSEVYELKELARELIDGYYNSNASFDLDSYQVALLPVVKEVTKLNFALKKKEAVDIKSLLTSLSKELNKSVKPVASIPNGRELSRHLKRFEKKVKRILKTL